MIFRPSWRRSRHGRIAPGCGSRLQSATGAPSLAVAEAVDAPEGDFEVFGITHGIGLVHENLEADDSDGNAAFGHEAEAIVVLLGRTRDEQSAGSRRDKQERRGFHGGGGPCFNGAVRCAIGANGKPAEIPAAAASYRARNAWDEASTSMT